MSESGNDCKRVSDGNLKKWVFITLVGMLVGVTTLSCDSDDPSGTDDMSDGSDGSDTVSGDASETDTSDDDTFHDGATDSDSADDTSLDNDTQTVTDSFEDTEGIFAPLPEGSRVMEYVVSLVDSDLEALHRSYLNQPIGPESTEDRVSLGRAAEVFYDLFEDEYDFLFFVGTESVSDTYGGMHSWVDAPTMPGTGVYAVSMLPDFGNTIRLKSCIGLDFSDSYRPAFAHEMAHHWAVHLDRTIGFGDGYEGGKGAHWGSVGLDGQLGGFNQASLRCVSPAGALPPDCDAEPDGRYLYSVDFYSPVSTANYEKPYADWELYLMGLMTVSEVTESYPLLENADYDAAERIDGKTIVAADGVREIFIDDIVAVHGERIPTEASERRFRGALVILSSAPVSDETMQLASLWAKSYSGVESHLDWLSFDAYTGGRASIDMKLGNRRPIDYDPNDLTFDTDPEPAQCDVLTQDCQEGFGCYELPATVCLPAGAGELKSPCEKDDDCQPGLSCHWGGLCAPYCDMDDPASDIACDTLCPEAFDEVDDSHTFDVVGARCRSATGDGPCDPLAQNCLEGYGCYGQTSPSCSTAGTKTEGETCVFSNSCEAGLICIGFADAETRYCTPFCETDGVGDAGCASVCPGGSWPFGAHSICMPDYE